MKVVAFYSFKGGVGRSNALFNVAYLLGVKHGARVVVADWDVHAPGLTCLYDLQDPDGHLLRPGVVDVLTDLLEPRSEAKVIDPGFLIHPTRVGGRIREATSGEGDLWFIPAGKFDGSGGSTEYEEQLQRLALKLPDFAEKLSESDKGKADLIEWFAERVRARFAEKREREPDYLLLDARTGLTEVGELLLSKATDQVVFVFGLNAQNLLGMEHMLRVLTEKFGAANVASRVVLVASPVPAGEEELKRRKLEAARAVIDKVIEEASIKASVADRPPVKPSPPLLVTVPYHPLLALTEELVAEHYPDSDPVQAFERLVNAVRVPGKQELEEIRQAVKRAVPEPARAKRTAKGGPTADTEHPLGRLLAWNVVRPDAPESLLVRGAGTLALPVLEGLANTVSLDEEREKILDPSLTRSVREWTALARALEDEQQRWREIASIRWPRLAGMLGTSWARWVLLTASRFQVAFVEASERLFHGWPYTFKGIAGFHAAAASADVLATHSEDLKLIARRFLARASDENPDLPMAHDRAGVFLLQHLHDRTAASVYFDKARAVDSKEWSTFSLPAQELHAVGLSLMAERPADALFLFENADHRFERALRLCSDPERERMMDDWVSDELNRVHALRKLGRESEALAVSNKALDLARRCAEVSGRPFYNLACALITAGHVEEALSTLETLQDQGNLGVSIDHMLADPDLKPLLDHPRFQALLAAERIRIGNEPSS